MRTVTCVLALLTCTAALHAQTPSLAEITALQRTVLEHDLGEYSLDIDAAQRLAILYGEGHLVNGDPIMSCSLFQLAHRSAIFRYHYNDHPITINAERLVNEYCSRLAYSDQQEAMSWMGCPLFGPKEPQTVERPLATGSNLDEGPCGLRAQMEPSSTSARRSALARSY
jgi:hypothetical protein